MDDGRQVRYGVQQRGGGVPVGDVARRYTDVRAECRQPVPELHRARRVEPPAAGEHQAPYSVCGDEVLSDQGAEGAGRTGEQDRAVGADATGATVCGRLFRGVRGTYQSRHVHLAPADDEFGFGLGGFQYSGGQFTAGVDVDEDEPAGVLRLRAAHQTPGGGGRKVRVRLGR